MDARAHVGGLIDVRIVGVIDVEQRERGKTQKNDLLVLHDRDRIFAARVDRAIAPMRRHVLKTPAQTPQPTRFAKE